MNLLFWWRATSKDFSYMDCADEMLLFEVRDMLESARSHIRWAVVKITGWWVAWLLPWYLLSFWAPDAFPQWFEPVVREKGVWAVLGAIAMSIVIWYYGLEVYYDTARGQQAKLLVEFLQENPTVRFLLYTHDPPLARYFDKFFS